MNTSSITIGIFCFLFRSTKAGWKAGLIIWIQPAPWNKRLHNQSPEDYLWVNYCIQTTSNIISVPDHGIIHMKSSSRNSISFSEEDSKHGDNSAELLSIQSSATRQCRHRKPYYAPCNRTTAVNWGSFSLNRRWCRAYLRPWAVAVCNAVTYCYFLWRQNYSL